MTRRHFTITGIVQGVGFRPFVFRLATELRLTGWVRNSPAGVEIELQGAEGQLQSFVRRLPTELPPLAVISSFESRDLPVLPDESGVAILPSSDGRREAQIAPDTAICADCRHELFDPTDRRYRHPFITCTNCGPRFTIVTGIPYDRPLTTMAAFPLCPACEQEYRDPSNRRFHAQPIACPDCGPRLSLLPPHSEPLAHAAALLRQGRIVAVKGLGGYHLAVDAASDAAVARLRQRKQRDEKPFAVMVRDMDQARALALLTEMEERLLSGPEAPIVILRRRPEAAVSALIAPGSLWIGLMLPYTPLHQLLFAESGLHALVMTSANAADEPMVIDEAEAQLKLTSVADAILTHNRPIAVRIDDSVQRVFEGQPLFYRRSRGYVPRPVRLPFEAGQILAVGAELKNTICLTRGSQGFASQHIGDLKNEATLETFQQTITHLSDILEIRPALVACDQHPDYLSTRYAEGLGLPLVRVQHHHAHLASCMAENGLDGELIGVIFDGTGLGDDGTIWGGEFLVGGYGGVERVGHLKKVRLPGGDAAAREPWRMAVSWLYGTCGDEVWQSRGMPALTAAEQQAVVTMLERGLNAPFTSSVGRLFDAAAFLAGIARYNSFDGQAGMALEALAETGGETEPLPYRFSVEGPFQLDLTEALLLMPKRLEAGEGVAELARAFHATLAVAVAEGCAKIRHVTGLDRVVLSGGVFQNRLLTEMVYTHLTRKQFTVCLHRLLPPNDGGICLGQAAVAARRRG